MIFPNFDNLLKKITIQLLRNKTLWHWSLLKMKHEKYFASSLNSKVETSYDYFTLHTLTWKDETLCNIHSSGVSYINVWWELMLILLLCTHIWDPHKLSTKQIIGHIAPKKNHNVWSPTVWKTRHKSTGILYHTLLGVLLESLQKKGKKNRAQIHTWNNGLWFSNVWQARFPTSIRLYF